MKKFSKILENASEDKYYLIEAKIQIRVKASNDGEASYIADSTLSGIQYQNQYTIDNISEITKEEFDKEETGNES